MPPRTTTSINFSAMSLAMSPYHKPNIVTPVAWEAALKLVNEEMSILKGGWKLTEERVLAKAEEVVRE